jgi:hypothetical protein
MRSVHNLLLGAVPRATFSALNQFMPCLHVPGAAARPVEACEDCGLPEPARQQLMHAWLLVSCLA